MLVPKQGFSFDADEVTAAALDLEDAYFDNPLPPDDESLYVTPGVCLKTKTREFPQRFGRLVRYAESEVLVLGNCYSDATFFVWRGTAEQYRAAWDID